MPRRVDGTMSDDSLDLAEEITLRVNLNFKKQHTSGLEVELRDDGYYYVSKVPRGCKDLGVGDRVLEINGTDWKEFKGQSNANAMIDTMTLGILPDDDGDDDSSEDDAGKNGKRAVPVVRKNGNHAKPKKTPNSTAATTQNKNHPYWSDSDDSTEPEKTNSFRRRSAAEEESRRIATERAKKKQEEIRRRQQQEAEEEEEARRLQEEEDEELQQSPGNNDRRSSTRSIGSAARPSDNNASFSSFVSPGVSPGGRKKRTSLRKSNIGMYSPTRAEGWTKVAPKHKSNG